MITKIKNLAHKLFGLYIIGGLTSIALVGNVFAQGDGPGSAPVGFGVNGDSSAGIEGLGGVGNDAGDSIITVIKQFINYALGLLALIALIMLLYGGFKMVTSGGKEDAYQEGLKILKNAAIGLAFISVSWFLVTFIFYVIGMIGGSTPV